MSINPDDLPGRMQRQEASAFDDFSKTFGPRLFRLFRFLGASAADAEALAVSCITDVALKVDRFTPQGPGSFWKWVSRIARRAWIDARRERTVALPLTDHDLAASDLPEPPAGVAEAVEEALSHLSTVDQEIVRSHYLVEELPLVEIAQNLQMEATTVRGRHHRLRPRLRALLADSPAIDEYWQARLRKPSDTQTEDDHE
jgi:RNA polymerase sigma factor (sigma-70 family)